MNCKADSKRIVKKPSLSIGSKEILKDCTTYSRSVTTIHGLNLQAVLILGIVSFAYLELLGVYALYKSHS